MVLQGKACSNRVPKPRVGRVSDGSLYVNGLRSGTFLCRSLWLLSILAAAFLLCLPMLGQDIQAASPQLGTIVGTALDVNGDPVSAATVVLQIPDTDDPRTVTTNDEGYFEFHDIKPGIACQVNITGNGLADWTSPVFTLDPGQFKILTGIQLHLAMAHTTVDVTQTQDEVATEQVQIEEKQRLFGVVPNFYVVYDQDAAPLTTKLKFKLALKVSSDPITFAGLGILAGAQQAGDTPDYGQGAQGYGKRFGANAGDGLSDIMIGGAILPSLLHQDPRYFYQGTGTTGSRMRHAMKNPFVCKGDNGKWQPNYSSLGGDLASSAISNLYYPKSNRGTGLVFANFAISTAERIASSVSQEFILGKLTHRPSQTK